MVVEQLGLGRYLYILFLNNTAPHLSLQGWSYYRYDRGDALSPQPIKDFFFNR